MANSTKSVTAIFNLDSIDADHAP